MKLLYENRSIEDQYLIYRIANDIMSAKLDIINKEKSDEFCAIYVEGRNREINYLEDFMSLKSFKLYSKYNYPIFAFVYNDKNFLDDNAWLLNQWRINIIKIPEIKTLQDYSKFCIKDLYFKLPNWAEKCITLQPDALMLKNGWEEFINNNKFEFIGAHWQHLTKLEVKTDNGWQAMAFNPVYGVNGGASFRKASKMRLISTKFDNYILRQINDNNLSEDSFYSYLGFNWGICKYPTLKECDLFSKDPLTNEIYEDKKNLPFMGHYFKFKSEFPKCNHN